MDTDEVICIPDVYLTANTQKLTKKRLIPWEPGKCMVHEVFTAEDVRRQREAHPGLYVLAHPECPPEVLDAADYSGSTSQMIDQVAAIDATKVFMVTECSMQSSPLHPCSPFSERQ
jgi:quinolinate synthase